MCMECGVSEETLASLRQTRDNLIDAKNILFESSQRRLETLLIKNAALIRGLECERDCLFEKLDALHGEELGGV